MAGGRDPSENMATDIEMEAITAGKRHGRRAHNPCYRLRFDFPPHFLDHPPDRMQLRGRIIAKVRSLQVVAKSSTGLFMITTRLGRLLLWRNRALKLLPNIVRRAAQLAQPID